MIPTVCLRFGTRAYGSPFSHWRLLALVALIGLWLFAPPVRADLVKPALVEISVNTNGTLTVEIRASIEALLTGINARYKNTQEAPNAAEYDALRVLQPEALAERFTAFQATLLREIRLLADDQPVSLTITKVSIPERGYTKVPRISLITLTGQLDRSVKTLVWYYPARFGDNAVRVRQVDEKNQKWHWSEWQWLRSDDASTPFSLEALFTRRPTYQVVLNYISIGYDHIVPRGMDHILFILGIFLLSTRLRPLLAQVTMFTIAHTLTLALSMNGIVSLPLRLVEPLIALSIAYVGVENLLSPSLHKSRLFLVFGFGLLHGLSFAGMLSDFGMPAYAFATALISFNIGVEFGQLAVITVAFLAMGVWFWGRPALYRRLVVVPGSLAISFVGLYWMLDRLTLFD